MQRQHRIVGHLILQSCAWILVILICMVLGDALVRRIMALPALERRQAQTLRMVLAVAVQVIGALLILLVLFGPPHETPTILGLTTAALTIALQDFVLAFFGWFVLMGKRGIRIGDWVEINGVSGEVIEVGLMRTTLARDRQPGRAGNADWAPHQFHEQLRHPRPVLQLLHQRPVDVGRNQPGCPRVA